MSYTSPTGARRAAVLQWRKKPPPLVLAYRRAIFSEEKGAENLRVFLEIVFSVMRER